MSKNFDDEFLMNSDNWHDYGLNDHLEGDGTKDWLDIGREGCRICEAEENSPMKGLLMSISSSAWRCAIYACADKMGLDREELFEDVEDFALRIRR